MRNASIEQARLCFKIVRDALEPCGEYKFVGQRDKAWDNPPAEQQQATGVVQHPARRGMGPSWREVAVADEISAVGRLTAGG